MSKTVLSNAIFTCRLWTLTGGEIIHSEKVTLIKANPINKKH